MADGLLSPTPQYAVKIIPPESKEAEIYEQLHRLDPASPNHTLPCDVIQSEAEEPFLIMPCLGLFYHDLERWNWGLSPLLDFFHQIIEGIEFLHELNIAHLDMYDGQVIIATQRQVAFNKDVQAGKAYIIDFDTSKRLETPTCHRAARVQLRASARHDALRSILLGRVLHGETLRESIGVYLQRPSATMDRATIHKLACWSRARVHDNLPLQAQCSQSAPNAWCHPVRSPHLGTRRRRCILCARPGQDTDYPRLTREDAVLRSSRSASPPLSVNTPRVLRWEEHVVVRVRVFD
ncbi:hypothetical protein L226DRAFT_140090 [Lentinus tigrinus ALCF2SS1-7]|uniref:Protein kinase domain-containing protein n=1 Tax=Lentinus tigrinus ALCF2SS1-6 TaxID=1328759 RepID=A0A5C2S3Z2_9APHY|nr:hypothetical protein L227DRAFT_193781 [Lentinus tigrinus ALCF2SS1-6]RPD72867.1 hypothetical protein L226DRAFT_140090 [Lentinus tigrinus ALCF2SS1-7]